MPPASTMTQAKKVILSLLLSQIVFLSLAMLSLTFFYGLVAVYSLGLGGLACSIPSLYFARKVLIKSAGASARDILRSFYVGEVIKLLLTSVLVLLFLRYCSVQVLYFWVGFLSVQLGHWLMPVFSRIHFSRVGYT